MPQFTAVVISKNGLVPYEIVTGDRVVYEPYLITALVRISVTEVAIRRFDILDREQKKAAIEIARKEDQMAFNAIDYAARLATGHNTVHSSTAGVTRAVLADTFAEVEKWNAPGVTILMHPSRFRDIRVWSRNDLDPVTHYEIRKTGYLGDLWGAAVRVSMMVPQNYIYVISEPQLFGVLSVRIDLSSWEAPDQQRLMHGWISQDGKEGPPKTWLYAGKPSEAYLETDKLVRQPAGKTSSRNFTKQHPNRLEKLFDELTPKFIKYVGDGTFHIRFKDGTVKNPDFVVRPFRKWRRVIEIFGEYYHKPEEEEELIKKYAEVGVKCLVVWEREIGREDKKRKALLKKINKFLDEESSETIRQAPDKGDDMVQTTF